MYYSTALLLVVLFSSVAAQSAGTCQSFESAPRSQCSSVVNYDVFVPTGLTQADLDGLAAQQTGLFFLGATTQSCSDAALRFVCAEVFKRCDEVSTDSGIEVLPEPTCFASCYRYTEECEDRLEELGIPIADCNAENGVTGQPIYPQVSTTIEISGGEVVTLPCNNPNLIGPYNSIPPGTCEPFQGAPLSGCDTVIGHDVYIPDGFTQEQLDGLAAQNSGALRAGIVPQACMEAGMRFICTQTFRKCFSEVVIESPAISVLLPESTCLSVCEDFNDQCEATFRRLGLPLQDCGVTNPQTGLPEYPRRGTELPLSEDITLDIPCMNDEFTLLPSFSFIPLARCEKLRPTTISQCTDSGVLDDYQFVYVAEGSSQRQLDEAAYQNTYGVAYPVVPDKCTEATFRFACLGSFLGCEEVPLAALPGAKIVLPVPPCKSVCEAVTVDCKATLEEAGRQPPDCELADSTGIPFFPEEIYSFTLGDQVISYPCNLPATGDVDVYKTCPGGFTDEDDECGLPCPLPVYSEGRYLVLEICIAYGAGLSLITSLILIPTYLLDKKKRYFPANLPMYVSIAAMLYAIGFLITPIFGVQRVVCDNDNQQLCRLQALILLYAQFALASWMMVMSFNMCLNLMFQLKYRKQMGKTMQRVLHIFYHILCWGIGIPSCIVSLALDKIAYFSPQLVCFTSSDPQVWPIIGVYTIPLFIIVCLTVLFTTIIVIGIIRLSIMVEKGFKPGKIAKALFEQWRMFLFLAVFLYIFCYNIEETIRAAISYDFTVDGVMKWAECVFENGDDEDCTFETTALIYALSLIFSINTSMQGFFVNIIFLSSSSTAIFWRDRFVLISQGKSPFISSDSSNLSLHTTRSM